LRFHLKYDIFIVSITKEILMDIKTMFPNLSLMWSRWSEYEITRRVDNGKEMEYIVPAPGAEQITFNCAERPETMVADAIGVGELIHKNEIPMELINLFCTKFASNYGLLGQMVGVDRTSPIYSTAPIYYAINSRKYGEELSYFHDCLHRLYRHFMTTRGQWALGSVDDMGLYGSLKYRLTPGRNPQLVWGVDSMEEVLWLTYASLVTEDKSVLKICKNCGRVYYNTHAKSEFCGPKCRNRYNVRMFREQ